MRHRRGLLVGRAAVVDFGGLLKAGHRILELAGLALLLCHADQPVGLGLHGARDQSLGPDHPPILPARLLLEGDPRTLPGEHGKATLEELFITVAREPLSLEGHA